MRLYIGFSLIVATPLLTDHPFYIRTEHVFPLGRSFLIADPGIFHSEADRENSLGTSRQFQLRSRSVMVWGILWSDLSQEYAG